MSAPLELRARLKAATAAAHERTHDHPGLAAAAAGVIEPGDYVKVLARLYGFHRAFEAAQNDLDDDGESRVRSHLLAEDLATLGLDHEMIARLPLCPGLTPPCSEGERLGALYVLEGSTLGGVQIARAMRAVIDEPDGAGRRFFLGYGARHGAMWRALLERIENLAADPGEAEMALRAAVRTFEQFELWMRDWNALDVCVASDRTEFA